MLRLAEYDKSFLLAKTGGGEGEAILNSVYSGLNGMGKFLAGTRARRDGSWSMRIEEGWVSRRMSRAKPAGALHVDRDRKLSYQLGFGRRCWSSGFEKFDAPSRIMMTRE
ncbi:hypothetical protein [Paraburkholderia sp. RL18-085-BIA-A]|uniref:hypothetical protein n=1 Tax=Paraburkholderia sp. RL18-085-BIA-A TaxID=3031633 RepID=UPI0038BB6169